MNDKDIKILAIESSCDETAASVVINGRNIISNVINSQIKIHTEYGGVVPEIASRKHMENIVNVVDEALKEADMTLNDLDAIAEAFDRAEQVKGKPVCIIADTIKGKGIPFAEGVASFHNGTLTEEQYEEALKVLG